MDIIKDALAQGARLASLYNKALSIGAAAKKTSRDQIAYQLQDSFTFVQGQNNTQNLTFNIPRSEDYEAVRFNLYPFIRIASIDPATQGVTERTFRPTIWAQQLTGPLTAGLLRTAFRCSIDALVELTYAGPDGKTRKYQNQGFYASQTFSALSSDVSDSINGAFNRFESPSAMIFRPGWKMERGSTLLAQVTPLYSGPRDPTVDDRLHEYQIRGVLEGFKRAT